MPLDLVSVLGSHDRVYDPPTQVCFDDTMNFRQYSVLWTTRSLLVRQILDLLITEIQGFFFDSNNGKGMWNSKVQDFSFWSLRSQNPASQEFTRDH